MKFKELDDVAKFRATIFFNSVNDAYGVNGTKEYPPADVDEMDNIAETNGWEFYENGDRKNY